MSPRIPKTVHLKESCHWGEVALTVWARIFSLKTAETGLVTLWQPRSQMLRRDVAKRMSTMVTRLLLLRLGSRFFQGRVDTSTPLAQPEGCSQHCLSLL